MTTDLVADLATMEVRLCIIQLTRGLLSSDYGFEFKLYTFVVKLDSHIAEIPDERTMFQMLC